MNYSIHPLSENSIIIQFSQNEDPLKVLQTAKHIENITFQGFVELIPAYQTITIYYDPFQLDIRFPFQQVKTRVESIIKTLNTTFSINKQFIEIPVCYEEEFAPDLFELAENKGLAVEDIIKFHTEVVYDVIFIGFSPGFPFLSGLNERLYTPRKATPRLKVARGSVGIAGKQTGIYSLDSPGGWQIIGRTPISLFNIAKAHPTLLSAGDQVSFFPISKKEFNQWEAEKWGH
ncbi:5-oxoprolinase subunit PxpB [Pseudoneobacillus sp. C159]